MTESAQEFETREAGVEHASWTDHDIELPGRGRTSIREAQGPPDAPTVVLLHGLAATGRLNWFTALPALSERFRVIVVDHPIRHELAGQGARASKIVPLAALGGGLGAWLLLHTGERAFDVVVPFLLVFAVALLAFQDQIRVRFGLGARAAAGGSDTIAAVVVGVAAIYGGYFGAGLGVVVLAALAVITGDSIVKLNALKQAISLAVNGAAAVLFFVLADLDLVIVGVMAAGSLVGGFAGGRLASRVSPRLLRGLVVVIGLAVAAYYFAKLA